MRGAVKRLWCGGISAALDALLDWRYRVIAGLAGGRQVLRFYRSREAAVREVKEETARLHVAGCVRR